MAPDQVEEVDFSTCGQSTSDLNSLFPGQPKGPVLISDHANSDDIVITHTLSDGVKNAPGKTKPRVE